ncbi:MAG: hypothetical protein Marn2KO_15280 [Marinobacter nauticus]
MKAIVKLHDRVAAILERTDNMLFFEYDRDYVTKRLPMRYLSLPL